MIYLELFLAFARICLCTLGGGYSSLPLIQSLIVEEYAWITPQEYLDVISISEMTPGAYFINYATFVGLKTAGVFGAVCATLGAVFPSFVIVLVLAFFYKKYKNLAYVKGVLKTIRPGITAIILTACLSIFALTVFKTNAWDFNLSNIDFIAVFIFIVAFVLIQRFKLNPIAIILCSGVVGTVVYTLFSAMQNNLQFTF